MNLTDLAKQIAAVIEVAEQEPALAQQSLHRIGDLVRPILQDIDEAKSATLQTTDIAIADFAAQCSAHLHELSGDALLYEAANLPNATIPFHRECFYALLDCAAVELLDAPACVTLAISASEACDIYITLPGLPSEGLPFCEAAGIPLTNPLQSFGGAGRIQWRQFARALGGEFEYYAVAGFGVCLHLHLPISSK